MKNELLPIIIGAAKLHLARGSASKVLLEVVENALNSSTGKTPERFELAKIWRTIYTKLKEAGEEV